MRRREGKTRNHRRRNDLQSPLSQPALLREAINRDMGPWLLSEYETAAGILAQKVKPFGTGSGRRKVCRFQTSLTWQGRTSLWTLFNTYSQDLVGLCAVLSPIPITLPTANLMLSTFRTVRNDLHLVEWKTRMFLDMSLSRVSSYFRCIDMQPKCPTTASRTLERQKEGFDLSGEGITFRYPDHTSKPLEKPAENSQTPEQKPALSDLSFRFEAGKLHAIVGDNGSGKTTLVHLLSQLYDNYAGTIKVNGYNIKEYNKDEIRSHVSIMFQEVAKFINFSVRENIGVGDLSTFAFNPDVIDAIAADFNVTDFVHMDTVIGNLEKQFKDPDEKWQTELSGGQWQKIALARVFITHRRARCARISTRCRRRRGIWWMSNGIANIGSRLTAIFR